MGEIDHYLDKRLDRLENKVDELLKFKWQIIGGSAIVAAIVAGLFEVVMIVIKK